MAIMPVKMNNPNNIDSFKQLVKSKLADYKGEVPPSGWEDVKNSLFAVQKAKVIRKRWMFSSVAAVAAALLGVFFVFQNIKRETLVQISEHHTTEEQTKPAKSIVKESSKTLSTEKESKIETTAPSLITDNSTLKLLSQSKTKRSKVHITDEEELVTTSSEEEDLSTIIKDEVAQDETPEKRDKSSDIDEKTKQKLIEEFINQGEESLALADSETSRSKKKSRNSISLIGKSGLSSSQYTNTSPNTLRTSLSDTYGSYTLAKMQAYNKEEEVKPESETIHNQPISFGLLTSFPLTRKLQIETGVVYTYLSSETKSKSSDFQNSEKVQFHYLGVPLNLNYTLMSINNLNLFVTAGAMIEKDINGKIKYYDEKEAGSINSGYASNRSSKIKQQNPQFSVTGGVGITYPIYDKANLFGKIGGRYYMKANNEYKTYYSDEKFGLDIQLGIKFNF